jgi:hypothetical protein
MESGVLRLHCPQGPLQIFCISACALLTACARSYAPQVTEQCQISPPGEWERLLMPPPQADQMLAITRTPLPRRDVRDIASGPITQPTQKAWFRSKEGVFRYCQYNGSTDQCYAIATFLDFALDAGGSWHVVKAAGNSFCKSEPVARMPPLKQGAECMYQVLKTMPGVSEPKLGYVTSEGWTHPYLEYEAAEDSPSVQHLRFEAKKTDNGKYWFLVMVSGVGAPDIHVTEAVMQQWKTQCSVEANVLFR